MDLISPKRDVLTEFMATTGCRISATNVDLITPKRNILTEFMLTTGCRISATTVDLITPFEEEYFNGIYAHDWTQNFCNHRGFDISKEEF